MYVTVPRVVPGLVRKSSARLAAVGNVGSSDSVLCSGPGVSLASPKSRILAWPRVVKKIFAGLMSRCMMPFECAASRPSAI